MKTTILEKSSELFLYQGFKTTTMDDICQAMGISKKTIYQYFLNKKDLIQECGKHFLVQLEKVLYELSQEQIHPVLFVFILDKRKSCLTHLDPNLASQSMTQFRKYYPKIYKNFIKNHFLVSQKYFIENLNRGIEQGFFIKQLPIDFVSRLFFSIVSELYNDPPFLLSYDTLTRKKLFMEYHTRSISTPEGISVLENYIKNHP